MGRPDVLRCRGGDRDTEGASGSSRPGNRPMHAGKTQLSYQQRTSELNWPSVSPALFELRKPADRDQTGQINSVA